MMACHDVNDDYAGKEKEEDDDDDNDLLTLFQSKTKVISYHIYYCLRFLSNRHWCILGRFQAFANIIMCFNIALAFSLSLQLQLQLKHHHPVVL